MPQCDWCGRQYNRRTDLHLSSSASSGRQYCSKRCELEAKGQRQIENAQTSENITQILLLLLMAIAAMVKVIQWAFPHAKRLTAKTTRRLRQKKIDAIDLVDPYRQLGRYIYDEGTYKGVDDFANIYEELDRLHQEQTDLEMELAGHARDQNGFFASAMPTARMKAVGTQIKWHLGRLGKAAYDHNGAQCGPDDLVGQIAVQLERRAGLDEEIAELDVTEAQPESE